MNISFKYLYENIEKYTIHHITDKVNTENIGTLSASRGNLSAEENAKRMKDLHSDLRTMGYRPIPTKGVFVENYGKPDARKVEEDSYFIHGKHDILPHLKKLGAKYDQESVLHKGLKDEVASLHGTHKDGYPGLDKVAKLGHYQPNVALENHSTVGGTPFSF